MNCSPKPGFHKRSSPFALSFPVLAAVVSLFASLASASEIKGNDPADLAPLDSFQECELCPEMIVMPPGSFMMGAIPGESRNPFAIQAPVDAKNFKMRVRGPDEINIIPNEHPRHRVEMNIRFAMGRNEITRMEWMRCVDAGACGHVPKDYVLSAQGVRKLEPGYPVANVSYFDALEYLAWLNGLVGQEVYRLPTEAEWEYAARAGTETRFAQGDDLTADQANFSRLGTEHLRRGTPMPELVDRGRPVFVDELDAANAWGLRHMAGNVNELTLSCWSDKHLGLPTDAAYLAHARENSPCRRVGKGGAYNSGMDYLRSAERLRPTEDYRADQIGFRVVRELK